jgi:hypothetical protein
MSDVKFTVEAVLDSKQAVRAFGQVQKAGEDTAKKVGDSFNSQRGVFGGLGQELSGLSGGFGRIGDVLSRFKIQLGLAAATVAAFKIGLDLSLEGEKAALELEIFNTAARNAGVNANELLTELERANSGIGDIGEISKIAALGLNELGAEAARYPELLEAARKLSIQFGTDVTETFQQLNQAVLSGRTRSLGAQFGVFTDLDQAQKNLAQSLGVATASLTEQEKRAAALNEVLRAVGVTTAAIDLQNETLAVKVDRVSNSFSELQKTFAELVSANLGGLFKDIADATSAVVVGLTNVIRPSTENQTALEIQKVTAEIQRLQAALADENASQGTGILGFIFGGVDEAEVRNRIDTLGKELDRLQAKAAQETAQATPIVPVGLTEEQRALAEQSTRNLNERILAANNEARLAEIQAQLVFADENERVQLEVETARIAHEQRLAQIAKDNQNLRFIDARLLEELELAERAKFLAQVEKITNDSQKRQVSSEKETGELVKQIRQLTLQALVTSTSQAFQRLGATLAEGGNAWKGFRESILGILGDLLINIGQTVIATSQALKALAAALANPAFFAAPLIAGGALIALGGLLKSLAGSSATGSNPSPAPAPTFGGGVTDTGGLPVIEPRQEDFRQRQTDQQVQVVINGDVLDSDQSGIRIVELINNAFDKQGVTVRRGVVA